eukprot:280164-Hanusia_phi.AAC.2
MVFVLGHAVVPPPAPPVRRGRQRSGADALVLQDGLQVCGREVVGDEEAIAIAVVLVQQVNNLLDHRLPLFVSFCACLELLEHFDEEQHPHEEEGNADGIGEEDDDDLPEDGLRGVGNGTGLGEVDEESEGVQGDKLPEEKPEPDPLLHVLVVLVDKPYLLRHFLRFHIFSLGQQVYTFLPAFLSLRLIIGPAEETGEVEAKDAVGTKRVSEDVGWARLSQQWKRKQHAHADHDRPDAVEVESLVEGHAREQTVHACKRKQVEPAIARQLCVPS